MLNYKSCLADPDLWMREAKNSNGEDYYEYVLLYTDDALVVSEQPQECLLEIDKYFPMKKGSIGTPRIYLGGKISQVQLPNGVIAYALSMSQYVQEAIKKYRKHYRKTGISTKEESASSLYYKLLSRNRWK